MSRGGRGGGRGGGGGGGGGRGGPFASGSSLMGGMSYTEVMKEAKLAGEAKLFPQAPIPDFADASSREIRSHAYMKTYLRKLRFSAYHVAIPDKKNESQSKYSDRYEDPVEELPDLASPNQKERMNPDFFPALTWQSYYSKKARLPKKHKKAKKEGGAANLVGEEGGEGGEEGKEDEEARSDDDEVPEDEFDDEEENADYDNNYFENGEEGDEETGGGGGADNEGGEY